jgi:type II secretory pathway component PulJ
MSEEKLQKKIAKLESINDQLQTEYQFLDKILKQLGFENGIQTLKEAAIELIEKKEKKKPNP